MSQARPFALLAVFRTPVLQAGVQQCSIKIVLKIRLTSYDVCLHHTAWSSEQLFLSTSRELVIMMITTFEL